MSDPTHNVTEADLHAYLDGQLAAGRRPAVEAYLAANPAEAARVGAYGRINAALRQRFDPVLAEPLPARLQPARRPARLWRAAAVVAWVGLGTVLGWSLHSQTPEPAPLITRILVRPAASAHVVYTPEVRHPVEVAAEDEQHLAAWLSKRLGRSLAVPQLSAAGYKLVGGRLLPGEDGAPAAQFMYQDESGGRLTLYVRLLPAAADTPSSFRFAEEEGVGTFYWVDGAFGYALTGGASRDRLLAAARSVYHQLNP